MDCSHEGIGVHTCGSNSNENAAVMCSDESSVTPAMSPPTTDRYSLMDSTKVTISNGQSKSVIIMTPTMTTTDTDTLVILSSTANHDHVPNKSILTSSAEPTINNSSSASTWVIILGCVCGSASLTAVVLVLVILLYGMKRRIKQSQHRQSR